MAIREWSDNLKQMSFSSLSAGATKESIDNLVSSITPKDPWGFLSEDSDADSNEGFLDVSNFELADCIQVVKEV